MMYKYLEFYKKLTFLGDLINKQRTGTPKELAKKLDVSKRTSQRMIEAIVENGVNIEYSRIKRSYVCKEEKIIVINFELKIISKSNLNGIKGGNSSWLYKKNEKILENFLGCQILTS